LGSALTTLFASDSTRAGDEGLAIICQGLEKNLSVQAIDLPENNITVSAGSALL
jgi:hypothetical protein